MIRSSIGVETRLKANELFHIVQRVLKARVLKTNSFAAGMYKKLNFKVLLRVRKHNQKVFGLNIQMRRGALGQVIREFDVLDANYANGLSGFETREWVGYSIRPGYSETAGKLSTDHSVLI